MLLQVFRELFPVFVALYLIEAVTWVRRSQLLFTPRLLGGGFVRKERGLRLASLWPGDLAFLVLRPPLIPGPGGIYLLAAEPGPAEYDPASWTWIPYEALPAPELDGEVVRLGGARRLRLPSPADAAALAGWLCELRRLDSAERERRIGEVSASVFMLASLQERQRIFLRKTVLLRWACFVFFLFLLVLLPLVLYASPAASASFLPVLIATAAVYLGVLWTAVVAARALRREGVPVAGGVLLAMTFSPPAAVHAASSLARDLLRGFDPLAAAAVLLPREELLRWARAELHGAACAEARNEEPGWRQHWSRRQRLLVDAAKQAGIEARDVSAAPPRRDPAAASYCPVCEAEYRAGFDSCDECGLPLLSLQG